MTADELALWRRRALRAEGAVFHALSLEPTMHYPTGHMQRDGARPEMAYELVRRLHDHFDHVYPDLVTRHLHQRTLVYEPASSCGCPDDDDDWGDIHDEADEHGRWLCSKKFLGYICTACVSDDGDGPDWKPDAVEWPCPPITNLNKRLAQEAVRQHEAPTTTKPETEPCDGCSHPVHPALDCPDTLHGVRCACDEPIAAGEG